MLSHSINVLHVKHCLSNTITLPCYNITLLYHVSRNTGPNPTFCRVWSMMWFGGNKGMYHTLTFLMHNRDNAVVKHNSTTSKTLSAQYYDITLLLHVSRNTGTNPTFCRIWSVTWFGGNKGMYCAVSCRIKLCANGS